TDHFRTPQPRILFAERHVFARTRSSRKPPRLRVQHKRQQSQRFCFIRKQFGNETRQKQRLFRQIPSRNIRRRRVAPSFRECRVNRLKHRVKPRGQFRTFRYRKRDPRLADFFFRSNQPLAHRRRRSQKRRRNRLRVQPQHYLKKQRRPTACLNPRVGAGKRQSQSLVRTRGGL